MNQPIWDVGFELPARPKAWARARRHGKIEFEAKEQKEHKATIIALAARFAPRLPHDGPVAIDLEFRLPMGDWAPWRQKAHAAGMVHPVGRPDIDNLAKMILDALTRSGRWWADDSRVVRLVVTKVYARAPGTRVRVRFFRNVDSAAEWKALAAAGERVRGDESAEGGPPAPRPAEASLSLFNDEGESR